MSILIKADIRFSNQIIVLDVTKDIFNNLIKF